MTNAVTPLATIKSIVRRFARLSPDDRKAALGITLHKPLPARHDIVVFHRGILMYLEERMPDHHPRRQRVRAQCPVCQRDFAAGNLGQHFDVHLKEA